MFLGLWAAQGGRTNAKKAQVREYGWNHVDQRDETYLRYAGLDAITCRRLVELLPAEIVAPGSLLEVEVWLSGAANRIKQRGLRMDTEALDRGYTEAKDVTDSAEHQIAELTGGIPAGSPKLRDWLGEHGVDWDQWPGDRMKSGAPSLAKDNLDLLVKFPLDAVGQQAVAALIRHKRHLNALRTTQGLVDRVVDGRIHPTLNPLGTVTGRMSCTGPNTQNISKSNPRMRALFLPEPGHILLTADFDQIELRVAAAFAGEQSMIDTILAGDDLHQLTADKVGISRPRAKTLNFAVLYGAGARRIAATAGMSEEEARRTLAGFWRAYPAIAALATEVKRHREHIISISGRRVPVPWCNGSPAVHKNLNYLVQGSARECLVDAWWRFDHVFGMGELVWLPIHDEIVMQVPADRVEEVAKAIEKCMSFDLCGVPISATAQRLIDIDGVSRWMTADCAKEVAQQQQQQQEQRAAEGTEPATDQGTP